jgi:hypothetical protein
MMTRNEVDCTGAGATDRLERMGFESVCRYCESRPLRESLDDEGAPTIESFDNSMFCKVDYGS